VEKQGGHFFFLSKQHRPEGRFFLKREQYQKANEVRGHFFFSEAGQSY
jgi:hypothetical protein